MNILANQMPVRQQLRAELRRLGGGTRDVVHRLRQRQGDRLGFHCPLRGLILCGGAVSTM
jgi:hypothetical protein